MAPEEDNNAMTSKNRRILNSCPLHRRRTGLVLTHSIDTTRVRAWLTHVFDSCLFGSHSHERRQQNTRAVHQQPRGWRRTPCSRPVTPAPLALQILQYSNGAFGGWWHTTQPPQQISSCLSRDFLVERRSVAQLTSCSPHATTELCSEAKSKLRLVTSKARHLLVYTARSELNRGDFSLTTAVLQTTTKSKEYVSSHAEKGNAIVFFFRNCGGDKHEAYVA